MIRVPMLILPILMLQGCASAPTPEPPPPLTIVNLQIETAADINPDASGKPSPVMLRIYELKEVSAFNAADFFALFDKEQATLAADLVHKQEMLIKPGETKTLTLQPGADVNNIGFFAAFRQLDTAQWRALVPVNAHQTVSYSVKIKATQLSAQALNQ